MHAWLLNKYIVTKLLCTTGKTGLLATDLTDCTLTQYHWPLSGDHTSLYSVGTDDMIRDITQNYLPTTQGPTGGHSLAGSIHSSHLFIAHTAHINIITMTARNASEHVRA